MIRTDRIFGLVVILGAVAYMAAASQIERSFLSDPVGPKSFPILVGAVAAICGAVMIWIPDDEPGWPGLPTLGALALTTAVLIAYAYALKPMGFLIPTAIAAGIISYQISPKPLVAAAAGIGLSVGLFAIFRFALGLSLQPVPKGWLG
ncbi:MAG: tripartite tricarboxylate transporter TctB family protein [Pseudomonadota bacterium]